MDTIALDAEAGQISAELARLGIAATARVHVVVEVIEAEDGVPMATLVNTGGGFAWLADEADLYTDADLPNLRA